MAIYRGTGGAGDATTDATVSEVTEQAVIATNKASEAAASATGAANSASSASSSATAAASSASAAAASASSSSDDADAAEAAKLAAQAAQAAAETAETNAETAETNAETAETNAAASASSASTSATTATTQAGNASTSASNAADSATAASASASSAATSATSASTSATTATTKAGEASSSATAAAGSATAAASSATAASSSATDAQTAKTAAEAAQTAAEAAEVGVAADASAAAASASAASTSESNAAASASAASTSETNAATSESNAATSATAASGSATAAASSATAASTSETNAATSASNASASETAASSSETAAASSATSASTSATNAATSESNASNSASAAATSASNASTSESNAATSASNASTSESNASSSATAAAGSATAAAGSASAASASADAALAALDNFDDRYLGQKATAPTVDNDGDALVTGALYFDTIDDAMKVWDGSQWLAAYASLSGALIAVNNLSDLSDASAARTNLGLGTAATTNSTAYATAAQGTLADSALQNVSEDTTPQLGGNLDTNGNDIAFGDNDKATFGAGSDLEIYHDGFHSRIVETGSGNLKIQATDFEIINAANNEYIARFITDGTCEFRYDNSTKLSTTSTGVNVTGTVTADGLTVDGGTQIVSNGTPTLDATITGLQISRASYPQLIFDRQTSAAGEKLLGIANDQSSLLFRRFDDTFTTAAFLAKLGANGDLSLYDDTGTTPKFFWDASAESLGIGTSIPSANVHVASNTNTTALKLQNQATSGRTYQLMAHGGGSSLVGKLSIYDESAGIHRFVLDSSGNVGIGTATPATTLDVNGTVTADGLTVNGAGSIVALSDNAVFNVNVSGGASKTSTINQRAKSSNGANAETSIVVTGSTGEAVSSWDFKLDTANGALTKAMSIDGSGDISFYEDTGTTAKFFWDASAESLGIGTTAPNQLLSLNSTLAGERGISFDQSGGERVKLLYTNSSGAFVINNTTAGYTSFENNGSERMRIDSSGNLLVGTTSVINNGTISAKGDGKQAITSIVTNNANSLFQGFNSSVSAVFQVTGNGTIQHSSTLYPFTDNAVDIGLSGRRYKDLYLSGNITASGGTSANWNTAYGWGDHSAAGYNTVIGTDTDINTSGATIIDNIYVTDGVITSMGTRTLTAADLGIGSTGTAQTASVGASGWWKCNDTGLIIQWGKTGSISANGNTTVTLPLTMPSAVRTIYATRNESSILSGDEGHLNCIVVSTSQIRIYNSSGGTTNAAFWMVIGN